jgi:CheY-like chemotaxis protein
MMPPTVLCVDDHEQELALRKELLQRNGYIVLTATDGFEAVEIAEQTPLSGVVLDDRASGMDSKAIAKVLKARHPQLPILMLLGEGIARRAQQRVDAFLSKAQSPEALLSTLAALIRDSNEAPEGMQKTAA